MYYVDNTSSKSYFGWIAVFVCVCSLPAFVMIAIWIFLPRANVRPIFHNGEPREMEFSGKTWDKTAPIVDELHRRAHVDFRLNVILVVNDEGRTTSGAASYGPTHIRLTVGADMEWVKVDFEPNTLVVVNPRGVHGPYRIAPGDAQRFYDATLKSATGERGHDPRVPDLAAALKAHTHPDNAGAINEALADMRAQ
jgi:hypothetical protein